MCLSETGCRESTNPRRAGTCVRCTKPMPPPRPPARDEHLEDEFLALVVELAERKEGVRCDSFIRRVKDRLSLGDRTYGDGFLTRDNIRELAEEPPDIPGYGVLELRKLQVAGVDGDDYAADHADLLAAAVHAALADWYVQRLQRRRAGVE